MQKANVTPTLGGLWQRWARAFELLTSVVISVQGYFLGASMAYSI